MESWLIFIGIILLLASYPLINAHFAAKTGKTSLRREVLARVWIFMIIFILMIIQKPDRWLDALLFTIPFIIGMTIWANIRYPVTESTYRAMYEQRFKSANREKQK